MGNALSVWSGYLHQGIAALIVAIDRVIELKEAGKDLAGYVLALENKEDFSIIEVDGAGIRKSEEVHQVKAYARKLQMSSFRKAIRKLQVHQAAEKRYLHTMYPIADWKVTGIEVLRYPYETDRLYMGETTAVEDLLLKRIKALRGGCNPRLAEMAAMNLRGQLDQQVTKEHREKKIANKYNLEIQLEDLDNWACADTELHDAVLFKIRRNMGVHYSEFALDLSGAFSQAPKRHREYLDDFVTQLIGLEKFDFESVLTMLSPHKHSKDALDTNDLYIELGWKENFLNLLTRVVKRPCEFHESRLPLFKGERGFYLPSLINDETSYGLGNKIRNNIHSAAALYEPDFIITRHAHNIDFEVNTTNGPDYEDGYTLPDGFRQVKSARHIMHPKKVALIGREEAIKELES